MSTAELRKQSRKQLLELQTRLQDVLAEKEKAEKAAVKTELADLAQSKGFSVEDLFGSRKGLKRSAAPKWRDPKNPSKTWSGRGRKPNWFNDKTAVPV